MKKHVSELTPAEFQQTFPIELAEITPEYVDRERKGRASVGRKEPSPLSLHHQKYRHCFDDSLAAAERCLLRNRVQPGQMVPEK